MPELQAGVRFGNAAKQFYRHHRTPVVSVVLSLVGTATGVTAVLAVVQRLAPWDMAFLAAGIVLAAALCLLQTRHFALAILTAVAPVPGLIWAAPISRGSSFGVLPVLAYGFGFAVAALVAQRHLERQISDNAVEPPWRAAGVALSLMGILAALWFGRTPFADAALQAVVDTALTVLSVAAVLPLAVDLLHFDESFVIRANRAREHRVRVLERVALVTVPRWGFSFTGIAIVFLALGWFGAEPVLRGGVVPQIESVLLVAVAGGVLAGGWREGLAVALICTVVCLMSLWATAVDGRAPFAAVGVLQLVAIVLFLALYSGQRSLAWRHADTTPVTAQRRALEQASGQVFAGMGAVVALLPALVAWPGSFVFMIGGLIAVGAATVSIPAAITAFEVLTPRRRSVEDLYGPRKKPVHS
jgi:hypothetical protein